MRNIQKISLACLTAFLVQGCTQNQTLCSSTASQTDPSCVISPDLGINTSLLQINFKSSSFFDKASDSLVNLPETQFTTGTVQSTVFLYSESVALSTETAMSAIQAATLSPSSINTNSVPHIKVQATSGVQYRFRYSKYDANNVKVYEKDAFAIIQDGFAYIPLTNSFLDNQLVTPGTALGTQTKNVFSIIAVAGTKEGLSKQVTINTSVNIQNGDFNMAYSPDLTDFSIEKRWLKYRKNSDYSAINDGLGFFTLSDQNPAGETSNLSVRVIFKSDLKMQIEQEMFEEMPFQFEKFKQSGEVTVTRGYSFYANDVTLDTVNDIKHRVYLGQDELRQDSLKAYSTSSYAAGKPFDINFKFNFNKSDLYKSTQALSQDPNGFGLHFPLRPQCFLEKPSLSFEPWGIELEKVSQRNSGNSVTVCNIDQNAYQVIPALNPFGVSLIDTWYGAFNYAPYRPEKDEMGNLYGIRHIKFKATGCLKVQVRSVTSTAELDWKDKTIGNTNCGDQASDKSWVFFQAEKVFTIFDNINQYSTQAGLKPILDTFANSSVIIKSTLTVNGEKLSGNTIRHLY